MPKTFATAGDISLDPIGLPELFSVALDDPLERAARALQALNALTSLVAGGTPNHSLNHVRSDDLAALLEMVGREIEQVNNEQFRDRMEKETRQ